jgi:hypothetical protein
VYYYKINISECLLRLPEKRVSMPSILKFGIQALDGLQALHEQGLGFFFFFKFTYHRFCSS